MKTLRIIIAAAIVLGATAASANSNYMSNGGRHAPVSTIGGPKLGLFRG